MANEVKSGELLENRMSLELQEAIGSLQPGQKLVWSVEAAEPVAEAAVEEPAAEQAESQDEQSA